MTDGEHLLDLVIEYQESRRARDDGLTEFGGFGRPEGREPDEIAADFEDGLRKLVG